MNELQWNKEAARWEKIGRKGKLVWVVAAALMAGFQAPKALAQGCIVARSTQQVINPLSTTSEGVLKPESQGGYLAPHQWELTIGFRHQFSDMHYVGSTYQEYRREQQSQVMNKINLPDFNLTYQATPRWSFSGDVPIFVRNAAFAKFSDNLWSARHWRRRSDGPILDMVADKTASRKHLY